jgi:hypothetical protein
LYIYIHISWEAMISTIYMMFGEMIYN